MYIGLVFSFFTIFGSLQSDAYADPPSCLYQDKHLVQNMGPARSQNGVGFCYAFSAVALMQQHYCSRKKGGCKYGSFVPLIFTKEDLDRGDKKGGLGFGGGASPASSDRFVSGPDDRLSVLDAISMTKGGGLVEGGFEERVLEAVKVQGEIAKENCAPFERMMSSDNKFIELGVTQNWWQRLKNIYEGHQFYSVGASHHPEVLARLTCRRAIRVKETADLTTDLNQIVEALGEQRFEKFLKKATIPKECENHRVEMPSFKVVSSEEFDPLKTKPIILEQLKQGRPVGVSICSKMNSVLDDECGAHAVVVSGSREKCCGNMCTTQFRIADSALGFWAKLDHNDGPFIEMWVDEEELLRKIHFLGIKWADTKKDPVIRWLE